MNRNIIFKAMALLVVLVSAAIPAATLENIVADDYSAPVLLTSVRPEPVEYAPGRLVEGYVTLEIRVGIDGRVKSANVLYRTSATAVPSAVRAAEKWIFEPARWQGEPVESDVVYSLPFGRNLSIFANDEYPTRYAAFGPTAAEEYAGSDCCDSPSCCLPANCCPAAN